MKRGKLTEYARNLARWASRASFDGKFKIDGAAKRIAQSGLFDGNWYLEKYPDVAAAGIPPLDHYLRHGAFEHRAPGPNFDPVWYVTRYPDILGMNPLLHYIDYGVTEGRTAKPPIPSFVERTKKVLDQISDLDPEIYSSAAFKHITAFQVVDGEWRGIVAATFGKIYESLTRSFEYMVFVPWLTHGGADLVAVNLVRSLTKRFGVKSTLVVVADEESTVARDWLPANTEVLVFRAFEASLNVEQRAELIEALIQAIRPRCVININSHSCWQAFVRRGAALGTFTRLYAGLFCRDYSADGRPAGYADTHFREAAPFLSGVILDNSTFAEELCARFGLPDQLSKKLRVLKQPIPNVTVPWTRPLSTRAKKLSVLWASRLCRQKNVDLLTKIVNQAPFINFDVWGRGDEIFERQIRVLQGKRSNIKFQGPYESFVALPISKYDAFLYTSLWDGIPNVLLEAAAAGIPIVASRVGGVGELVTDQTGWPITEYEEPNEYIRSLTAIHSSPTEARQRADAMSRFVTTEHSWVKYEKELFKVEGLCEG